MPHTKKNDHAIRLPNPVYFQASQCSAWLPCGNGKFKEVIFKRSTDRNGKATWIEVKASK